MTKKTRAILLLIILVILVSVYIASKKAAPELSAVNTSPSPAAVAPSISCYFKETVGTESSDEAFTSINYEGGDKVHGIINFIPGEKDSLVGTYTGTVENNTGMAGYSKRLNVIYSAYGEGILSKQQEVIVVGENDIKTGTGEMHKDTDGVWKIKDMNKLTYDNPLPKVDCANVPEKIKADYSKTK